MAVLSGDRTCIFDASTLSVVRWVKASGVVHATAISPDGRHCAIGAGIAPTVDIYDADDGHLITSLPPQSPCVGFSPDGRWFITGSAEEYRFWERSSWKLQKSIPRGQTGGSHGKFAFTPDGKMVALAVGRGEVGLFDTSTFELLATLESPEVGNVAGLAFGNNGAQLAVSTILKSIHVWDLRLIRKQLAEMKLDYPAPSLSSAAFDDRPTELTVTGKPGASSRNLQFPPRDARCTASQIDLTRHYNAVLTNGWFYSKWTNIYLSGLPQGLVELDGMSFDVRGVIQVGRNDPAFAYPSEVAGIPVHQPCQKLHFLHATGWGGRAGEDVGEYVVRYEDRAERSVPITYQENIWCWWDELHGIPPLKPDTTVAWRGNNPMSRMDLVLFHFRWENPRPDVPIASLTFRSRMTPSAPFLIAITAE